MADNINNQGINNTTGQAGEVDGVVDRIMHATKQYNASSNAGPHMEDPTVGDRYGDPNKKTLMAIKGYEVIGVQRNTQGDIEEFVLSNGERLSYDDATHWVSKGLSNGLILQKGNQDQWILRSAPDGDKTNNLDSIPEM